jgi:predicted ATP-grasp superfamily ATP-dependent carboligase
MSKNFNKSKILITSAGTGTAFSYVNAIAKNFNFLSVITADINPAEYVTSSIYSEKHFQVPMFSDEKYSSEIESILIEEDVDYYLPLIDEEINKAFNSEILKKRLVANSKDFCNACIRKNSYHDWAKSVGLKSPKIFDVKELFGLDRIVLKKNGGFGSKDTKIINPEEIIDAEISNFSCFEYIGGDEYTVDCYPKGFDVISTVRKRVEVKNGVCVKAEISRNEDLENVARKIVGFFKLTHPFCFQVIEKKGEYYLIDLNPRLGAGTGMGIVTGKDYFSAHIAQILGLDINEFLKEKLKSCIITRQYSNYLMKVF